MFNVVLVALGILLNVAPPSVLICHCTVGVGLPFAAAVNVAPFGAHTSWFVGFVVTVGAVFTVSVAAVVVALPHVFVNTARYFVPLRLALVGVMLNVVLVAVGILLNVAPPSVLICHCTVGAGLPFAAAVKLAPFGSHTSWFVGFVVTDGAVFTVS